MQLHAVVLFETPQEIYARIWANLAPRRPCPELDVRYCRYANANAVAKMRNGRLEVRITDLLEGAPAQIQEALAYLLLGKLLRITIPPMYSQRYRRYLHRPEMRRCLHLLRQERGRKYISGPAGEHHHLEEIFEDLNTRFFHGLMARPMLGWSRNSSRSLLGHYDPSHNAIILSKRLDQSDVPRLVVEYVMFHEMLHLRYPAVHQRGRRQVHTKQLREAEKEFPLLKQAKELLRKL